MKVLIIDGAPVEAEEAVARLRRAGHETTSCRPDGRGAVCRGVELHGRCPLDEGVDVALAAFPLAELDRQGLALGYVCAQRAGVPVVAIGDHSTSSHDPTTTTLVSDLRDVVAVLAGTASRPLERHTAAARRAVRDCLDRHDLAHVDSSVWVERQDGRLSIRMATDEPVPPAVTRAAAVRVLAAVRQLDPNAPAIGVATA